MKATKEQHKHLLSFIFDDDKQHLNLGLNLAIDQLDFSETLTYTELKKEIKKRKKVLGKLFKMTYPEKQTKASKMD